VGASVEAIVGTMDADAHVKLFDRKQFAEQQAADVAV
jgi:hypothetical protein